MSTTERIAALSQRVLAACDAEDWNAAAEALGDHDRWIRAEAKAGRLNDADELATILAAQVQLGEELQRRLGECSDVLGDISKAGRGARAYRAESER